MTGRHFTSRQPWGAPIEQISRIVRQAIPLAVSALFVSCSWGKGTHMARTCQTGAPTPPTSRGGEPLTGRHILATTLQVITIAQKEVNLARPQR
jgi:hypothetical protein